MSGIAGIIHFDGKPIELGLIEKMTGAMAYRGPDGIHHWVKGSVALGQCMLQTTTESLEEQQPLTCEDESLVLVMDGRVDNWEELRQELLCRGVILRDRSDAELVLRSYEIWGGDCLQHIDGDFALVIWDSRRQEVFCARDRLGNKSLNYHWNGSTFVFGSEVHVILGLPWVNEILNEGMLVEFLSDNWYSRDETLWRDVLRLVAGYKMTINATGYRLKQYWLPDLGLKLSYNKDEEYIEHYRELFIDIVRRLSRSHLPIAYEVSGGLDSSAVFSVAEYLRRSDRLPAPGISGYTLAFTDDKEADELPYARLVGEYLGLPIHEVSPFLVSLSWYEKYAKCFRDFPGYPNGVMSVSLMNRAATQGSRVVLTGEGGDQWLQGSRLYYAEELEACNWLILFNLFKTDVSAFGVRQAVNWLFRQGFFSLLPESTQEGLRRLFGRRHGQEKDPVNWLSPEMVEVFKLRRSQYPFLKECGIRRIGQGQLLQLLHLAFTTKIMERLERLGSHSGLEIRHPFWNARMVQYALSTPERLRLRGKRNKYIHVQAMQELMHQGVIERTTKADFSGVFHRILMQMEEDFTEVLPKKRAEWVSTPGISKLYKSYQSNPQDCWPMWILWGLYGCDKVI